MKRRTLFATLLGALAAPFVKAKPFDHAKGYVPATGCSLLPENMTACGQADDLMVDLVENRRRLREIAKAQITYQGALENLDFEACANILEIQAA